MIIIRKNNHFYEKIGKKGEEVCIDDELPFEIPDSWEWVRLITVNNIFTGNSINKTEKESKFIGLKEGYNYIGTKDVGFDSVINYENGVKIPKDLEKFRIAPKNSVLLCIEGGSAGRKIGIIKEDVCFGNKLACFNSYGIDSKFLFYYLQSSLFKNVFKSEKTGIIGGVSIGKLRNLILPLPPLEEQKRIVNLLNIVEEYVQYDNKLNNLNKKFAESFKNIILQEAIQGKLVEQNPNDEPASVLLKRIKEEKEQLIKDKKIKRNKNESFIYRENNHFYEKIGKKREEVCIDEELPFDIPDSWEWVRFNNILNIVSARRVHQSDWKSEGIPFYRAREIAKLADFGFVDNDLFISQELYDEFKLTGFPKENDLMVTGVGTLGKVYIVKKEDCFYYKDASVLCFENFAQLNPYFLKYFMKSPFSVQQIKDNSRGTTVATITIKKANSYLMPLPPLEEQKRIIKKVKRLNENLIF